MRKFQFNKLKINKNRFMKIVTLMLSLLTWVALLAGCNDTTRPSDSGSGYHKITAKQAKDMMDSGNPYILVDVRTDAEFKAQRIDGAILIPYDEISDQAATELPDENAVIITYCRTGVRSSTAAHTLADMGYTNVYDMGGIVDWPYDTVSG